MVHDVARGEFDEALRAEAELDPRCSLGGTRFAACRLRGGRHAAAESARSPPEGSSAFLRSRAVVVGTGDEHAGASVGASAIGRPVAVVVDVTGTAELHHDGVRAACPRPALVSLSRRTARHAWCPRVSVADRESRIYSQRRKHVLGCPDARPTAMVFCWPARHRAGSEGACWALPVLSGATALRWNDQMRGALLGLAMTSTRSAHGRAGGARGMCIPAVA